MDGSHGNALVGTPAGWSSGNMLRQGFFFLITVGSQVDPVKMGTGYCPGKQPSPCDIDHITHSVLIGLKMELALYTKWKKGIYLGLHNTKMIIVLTVISLVRYHIQ